MKRLPTIILILVLTSLTMMSISSCYRDSSNHDQDQHDAVTEDYTAEQLDSIDSISFYSSHHYTEGFNFKVYADSLFLLQQQPEEIVSDMSIDSFPIYKDHQVVVGDIRIIPQDSIDSVWVQLATDEGRWGWIHETQLLPRVVPDDPISEFIMIFSNNHIIISLIIVAIIAIAYIARTVYRKNAPIVHLRDIPSFYPTLLCLTVATAATFYASLQMFAPDTWRNFYYHPSLNPFKMPFILSIFMSSVWTMVILSIAVVDDVRRHLNFTEMVLYNAGLIGVCAVNYIVFSLSTLYYIGYPLLIAYFYFAITRYMRFARNKYICGNCGKQIRHKGKCPYCGAVND